MHPLGIMFAKQRARFKYKPWNGSGKNHTFAGNWSGKTNARFHLKQICHTAASLVRHEQTTCMKHRSRGTRSLHAPQPPESSYAVRNTMMMIQANPAISGMVKMVPSMMALVTAADTGSTVPMRLARMEPISFTPCM